jgi:hypothetical protein
MVIRNAATLLLFFAGCNRKEPGSIAEPYLAGDASVAFELEPVQSGSSQQWIGTYASQGKVARFRIEFGPAKVSGVSGVKDFNIKSGEGRFAPEVESDSSVLLADLQKALQAKILPRPAQTRSNVPFTFANIGENLSQAKGGGFNAQPPGNWTAIKLFLGEADREGEVFLNINPKMRKGQFSMKDPDYGDFVLAELAKVL